MKKILLLFLAITSVAHAQLSQKVMQSFPAHIIYKINEVASKIKLTEEQQIKIGKQLTESDSTANALLRKNGSNIINLQSYYDSKKVNYKDILSEEQLDNYSSQIYKNNRFLLALKSASQLELTNNQIKAIRKQNDLISKKEVKGNPKEVYIAKLDSILTKKQYASLMELINVDKSKEEVLESWKKLKKLQLVTIKDSSIVYNKIYQYFLQTNNRLDTQSQQLSVEDFKELKTKNRIENEPTILTRYQIVTDGKYKKNLFSEAIKNDKILNLTSPQIDSLLVHFKKLELIKYNDNLENINTKKSERRNNYASYENVHIRKIINPKQLHTLLESKYQEESIELANRNWIEFEKKGLTNDLDKNSTIQKLVSYHTKYLIITTSANSNDKKNTVRDRVKLNDQPSILTRYEILSNGDHKKNLFAEAIKQEQNLTLTPTQIDSLLVCYKELELTKYNDKIKNDLSSKKEYSKFESDKINKIIDPKQLNILLVYKNRPKATLLANSNWAELEKQGLNKDLDKATVLKQFAQYHLNDLIANDKVKMSNNQMNMFNKRDVQRSKPELLKQLDVIKQTAGNTKSAKNSLKW